VTEGQFASLILVDPGVDEVGIDLDALVTALRGVRTARTRLVPGLGRHPELLTAAVKGTGARRAVVVTAELERPPVSELRTWGEAGGLDPLGVQAVALDILRAGRSATERTGYAVRMVRAALAALATSGTAQAARRPVGASLSRRGVLSGRATTWVPVAEVDPAACLGTQRCERCVRACPEAALQTRQGVIGAAPVVDASRCQACSGCLDICPTGALKLDGHHPATLARQLRGLLRTRTGDCAAAPSLVISCQRAAEPLHRLGERAGLPGWLVLEVACLGGVGSAWHLAALAAGAPAVRLLPCQRCRDRGALTEGVDFTRRLLTALGDVDAAGRVAILPAGPKLQRAVLAAGALSAMVDGAAADRMPVPGAVDTPALLASWAVRELRRALGAARTDRFPRGGVILGQGAPLGVLTAADGCTACGACLRSCPTRALSLTNVMGVTDLALDPSACTGCGLCVQTCPERVLDVARGVDLEQLDRCRVQIARVAAATCPGCGEQCQALPATVSLPALPAGLAGRCPGCRRQALLASL